MIPVIAGMGRSFEGAFAYYFHDKGAKTSARVAWTHTRNLLTDCAEKAWKVMAYTAKAQARLKEAAGIARSGRKLEKPVLAYSLSWHPEQDPDKETMLEAAQLSLEALGLTEHEAIIAAHTDEPHPHIHIIVNRCHPVTGKAASSSHSRRKLSDFAREWERKEGKVYCMNREENYQKRTKGRNTRHVDPVIAEAWALSNDAQGFMTALEKHGYDLARGRKRLVVVDAYGKTINPLRHLTCVHAAEFHRRMKGIDTDSLPTPEVILARRRKSADEGGSELPANQQERVAETINRQMARHHEEKAKLCDHHRRLIAAEKHRLDEFYQFRELDRRIDTLKAKLRSRKPFARLAQRIFKPERRIAHQVEALTALKESSRSRLSEAIGRLELERDLELQILAVRHAHEIEDLVATGKSGRGTYRSTAKRPDPPPQTAREAPTYRP